MKLYTVADLAAMAGVGIQMIRNRLREHHIKPADWRTFKSRTGGARQALYPPMDIILKTEAQMLEEKGWIKIPRLREAFGTTQFRLMTFLKGCGAEHVDVHHDKKTMTLWRLPGGEVFRPSEQRGWRGMTSWRRSGRRRRRRSGDSWIMWRTTTIRLATGWNTFRRDS